MFSIARYVKCSHLYRLAAFRSYLGYFEAKLSFYILCVNSISFLSLLFFQMGRGRTTTGTVIACLLKLRIEYGRPIRLLHDNMSHEDMDGNTSSGEETTKEESHAFGMNDILLLWKITRLFDNGVECREALDAIIDRCSALQNIRQAVLHYRKLFNQQHVEQRVRTVALNRGAEYLEWYFRLIAFAAYLGSEAFDGFCGQGGSKMTFKNWLHQRPEVQAMKWSIRLRPGRFFTVPVNPFSFMWNLFFQSCCPFILLVYLFLSGSFIYFGFDCMPIYY